VASKSRTFVEWEHGDAADLHQCIRQDEFCHAHCRPSRIGVLQKGPTIPAGGYRSIGPVRAEGPDLLIKRSEPADRSYVRAVTRCPRGRLPRSSR
jgi:hypothetical protein